MSWIYLSLVGIAALHFMAACVLTREILEWPFPNLIQKIFCLVVAWLVPVYGIVWAYKKIKLDWFGSASGGGNGNLLLGIDAFFNPGARHQIEAKYEAKMEITRDDDPEQRSHNIKR